MDLYHEQIKQLGDSDLGNSVAGVLYSVVMAVTAQRCSAEERDADSERKPMTTNDIYDPLQCRFVQLSAISSPTALLSLTRAEHALRSSSFALAKPTNPLVFEACDDFSRRELCRRYAHALGASSEGESPALAAAKEVQSFALQAVVRLQAMRLLFPQDQGLPLRAAMTSVERGIKETELLTFTSLCSSDLFRSHQLLQLEDMVLAETKALPNFTGAMKANDGEDGSVLRRKYFRQLSAFLFAQLLAKELAMEPVVLRKYYEMTDELLFALHWIPPNRRNHLTDWNWRQSEEEQSPVVRVESVAITPAGKSIGFVKEVNADDQRPWLTVHYHDCCAGVRLSDDTKSTSCSFFVHSEEDVRVSVFPGPRPETILKPDKCGTVCLSASFPSGLSVSACTNGDVRIASNDAKNVEATLLRRDSTRRSRGYPLLSEISRFVSKEGTIVRRFSPDSAHPFAQEIMKCDGSRELFLKSDYSPLQYKRFLEETEIFESFLLTLLPIDVRWISLLADGSIESCTLASDGETFVRAPPVPENIAEELIDAESKSVSRCLRDGRMLTFHRDGRVVAVFPDHTQFLLEPASQMLWISRAIDGWPSIELDLEVDRVCRSHCRGIEVPINKGGDRVRLRVALPDGSGLLVKYDTRVTAKTNGSLQLVQRSRSSIIARDDCSVQFKPSTAWTNQDEERFLKDCKIEETSFVPAAQTMGMASMFFPSSSAMNISQQQASPATSTKKMTSGKDTKPATTAAVPSAVTTAATSAMIKSSRRNKTTGRRTAAFAATPTTAQPNNTQSAHELFTSSVEPDAEIFANLLEGTCAIKDYEFNTFDMDLAFSRRAGNKPESPRDDISHSEPALSSPEEDNTEGKTKEIVVDVHNKKRERPLDISVILAGEVPGLKPPAVARFPKPPRLFVVNRHGDATEVMSVQDVTVLEHHTKICSDAMKVEADALISPSELGPAKNIRYFTQRKLLDLVEDGFSFKDIFGTRKYHDLISPASTLHFLRNRSDINLARLDIDFTGAEKLPRVFEVLSLIERSPLSQGGYQDVIAAFQRCDNFRTKRNQSMDRFAVQDPRTSEQIEEEEQLIKRLKQAYKLAKINAAKRKEHAKERVDRIDEGDEEEEEEHSQSKAGATKASSKDGSPVKRGKDVAIMERQDEDDDDEDNGMDQFSDDEEKEVDPEVIIVKNAFDDYCSPSVLVSWGADVLKPEHLQEIFIRLFNRFISQEDIDAALSHTTGVDSNIEELNYNEFRAVYQSMKRLINGESLSQRNDSFDDEFMIISKNPSYDFDQESETTEDSHGYMAIMSSPNNDVLAKNRSTKSAPPLNLKVLDDRSNVTANQTSDSRPMTAESFPAGSAMNHIRKVKSNAPSK